MRYRSRSYVHVIPSEAAGRAEEVVRIQQFTASSSMGTPPAGVSGDVVPGRDFSTALEMKKEMPIQGQWNEALWLRRTTVWAIKVKLSAANVDDRRRYCHPEHREGPRCRQESVVFPSHPATLIALMDTCLAPASGAS